MPQPHSHFKFIGFNVLNNHLHDINLYCADLLLLEECKFTKNVPYGFPCFLQVSKPTCQTITMEVIQEHF